MTAASDPRIPVTVLTGFLGAGKTTLVNRILDGTHGRRYAVVVNEFGEAGIDGALVAPGADTVRELANGCLCCTVQGDLVRTLHELAGRAPPPDGIIIETSGLADPGPVAEAVRADPFLEATTRLDAIVTLVDARHILARLADSAEAAAQIALADVLVLNKCELASAAELTRIEARLAALNPTAPIRRAVRSDVPLDAVMGIAAFDLDRVARAVEAGIASENPPHGAPGHVHDAACVDRHHDHEAASGHHPHAHTAGAASVSLTATRPLHPDKLSAWLQAVVSAGNGGIWRSKGILCLLGEDRCFVLQSVGTLVEGDFQRAWAPGEPRLSRLVVIGRDLDAAALGAGFDACAA